MLLEKLDLKKKLFLYHKSNSSTSSNNSLAMLARGIGICASNENSLSGLNLTCEIFFQKQFN